MEAGFTSPEAVSRLLAWGLETEGPWPVPGMGKGDPASTSSFVPSAASRGFTPEGVSGPPPWIGRGLPHTHAAASATSQGPGAQAQRACYPLVLEPGLHEVIYLHVRLTAGHR